MDNREAVERFHLVFLRHFAAVVSPGTICLKGGANLRLCHNSPRLSEGIDFDARVAGFVASPGKAVFDQGVDAAER